MGNDWLRGVWNALWASDIKWTDVAIVLFTFGQVWIGVRQSRIARRQTEISNEQTRIQEETRDIALSALNRPYLIVDFTIHNMQEWYDGEALLKFEFRFSNYGASPAIVRYVSAYAFFSSGNRSVHARDNWPARFFPRPEELDALLYYEPYSKIFPEKRPDLNLKTKTFGFAHDNPTVVLRPGEAGPAFEQIVHHVGMHPRDEWFVRGSGALADAAPWLIGSVDYEAVSGQKHCTRFCFRGRSDGAADEVYAAPYNERS
ncbi:hypothetical protein [Roseicella aerolata]|uniref:Uncharacterized protein n=1 Tax=Roseicella aerolata TaxID=2883479 RepID=A0A9X1IJX5_9PROT|nr:hypothetical protein [Roseicella aerolata]MCB4825526.1 hypothetical protein [Roseicella aerolata]